MRTRRAYQRDDATGGRLGPVSETLEPAQIEGVRQMGGPMMPAACPHCHSGGIAWVVDARSGWCRTCGADWFLTIYAVKVHRMQPIIRRGWRLKADPVAVLPAIPA